MKQSDDILTWELLSKVDNLTLTLQNVEKELSLKEQELAKKMEELAISEDKAKYLQYQLDQLKRMIYGTKSERFKSVSCAQDLKLPFDFGDEPDQPVPATLESIHYIREKKPKKAHPGRLDFPSHIPTEDIIIEPEQDTLGLVYIGDEITRELDIVPLKLFCRRYIRRKYALPGGEGIVIGKLPSRPIEKGNAGPGLLASIAVDKFVDHLPLYRQNERFKRLGIQIPSNTIDSWIAQTGDLLEILYQHLITKVLSQGYIQGDESPIPVLDRAVKGKTHQGYFWYYNAPLQNAVFVDYRQGRGRAGPREMLKNFTGYLQTDGYKVYDWFGKQSTIIHVGCWAHARRYFEKALEYDKENAGNILIMIQKLYSLERKAKKELYSAEQRCELRMSYAVPVLSEIGYTLEQIRKTSHPKSPLRIAAEYTLTRWESLLFYVQDGLLEIDNNWVENAIRPTALGRKNFLFAGSHTGARRAAIFYSLFGTCKKNNVNPYEWLSWVLSVINDYPAKKIDDLLPQNFKKIQGS